MGNHHPRHLTVNGSAMTSGGTFNKVKIRGDGTINGDLRCDQWKVFGNADVSGNVEAKTVDVFGQANIRGNAEVGSIKIFGEMDIHGYSVIKDLNLRGVVRISENLVGGAIHGYGEIKIDHDCEADSFSVKGVVEVGKTLNAEHIDLYLHVADSRIAEIGGKTIRVTKSKVFNVLHFLKRLSHDSAKLWVETIEGDEIYLEHTNAKIVRGNHIIIGPGCDIELVEYQESFQQDEKATVRESKKI
ncbi:polymer-forming cytoskeletal protein [Thermaerobacillus caldiproteolyticus]|uniref:Cytoskeletal protein CcmA (Bactofilin family) n=1 Tax=Thermaerobacillus caldiproteolyticus TaxID=247480 RepID=A0A7V9Z9R2_9BACL|nr:polymer-forming cytoskeletal protein [Anoxybacillus caldiproteolyticus]MBA2876598.1 cytoskeletal protein CcmA (bactofilin family) [Anoxybacillus caldiproteolyticus]